MSLHTQLIKERACSEDLITMIGMHIQDGRYDLAADRSKDLNNSISRLQRLQQRLDERKKFHQIAADLNKKGILAKAVSLYEKATR